MTEKLESLAERKFAAMLFDMDGTITHSIEAAERVWARWAKAHGLDVEQFLPTIHGVRTVDTIARLNLPGVDPEAEAKKITATEITDTEGVKEIPGAAELLRALPAHRWAVVTSAPRALARSRMQAAGLPLPEVMIAAEDVSKGKPDPEGYRKAAQQLGVEADACLIFEDAPAGVEAAVAAGGRVVVVTSTHTKPHQPKHLAIENYRGHKEVLLHCLEND